MTDNAESSDPEVIRLLSGVQRLDIESLANILGLQKQSDFYFISFFNRNILFDQNDFFDPSGQEVTSSVKALLCRYMLNVPVSVVEKSNRLITFREFSGAGPLFSRFTENTNKIVEQTFSGQLARLENKSLEIGGKPAEASGYDLSFRFQALPGIPVLFYYNDKDDMLPAQSSFLFHDNADKYLDIKSLGTIATYLTGLLIQ